VSRPITRFITALFFIGSCAATFAQTRPPAAATPGTRNVEVDPIRCWWRTTTGAVRIGETFTLVLTCAVLQNEAVQVVPDESRLVPAVMQMAPFEVVKGTHPGDLFEGDRRFFQYEYLLRLINPDEISKDVRIPDLLIHYRVNSKMAENAAVQGRDQTYVLPPMSVRLLSMVPADAGDIRDTANETFDISDTLTFRARVLEIVSITAAVLGGLIVLLSLVRVILRARRTKRAETRDIVSTPAVLRQVTRELSGLQRETEAGGWNETLVDRAMSATRLAAAVAVGRPIGRVEQADAEVGGGRLVLPTRGRRKRAAISGSVTADNIAKTLQKMPINGANGNRGVLEELQTSLAAFTAAQYARIGNFDRSALDEALRRATEAASDLRSTHAWPKPMVRRWFSRSHAEEGAKF
jgi:hypothetical protein